MTDDQIADDGDFDTDGGPDTEVVADSGADTDRPEGSPGPPLGDEQSEEGSQQRPGVRQRLKDAEAERDNLRDVLARTRQRIFEEQIRAEGLEPPLMAAAGLKVEDFVGEDGLLDVARLAQAIEGKRLDLGLPERSRRPKPNPLVGGGSTPTAPRDLADVLREAARGPR